MRTCKKCGLSKADENFYVSRVGRLRWECKKCSSEIGMVSYRKNREKILVKTKEYTKRNASAARARNRARKYGISEQEYQKRLAEQDGCCAICKGQEAHKNNKVLSVDHCHTTKKIRGLLCSRCNLLLGRAKDSPVICRLAAAYLEKANASEPQEDIDDGAYV